MKRIRLCQPETENSARRFIHLLAEIGGRLREKKKERKKRGKKEKRRREKKGERKERNLYIKKDA